jgi:hypothetical protein
MPLRSAPAHHRETVAAVLARLGVASVIGRKLGSVGHMKSLDGISFPVCAARNSKEPMVVERASRGAAEASYDPSARLGRLGQAPSLSTA